QALIDAVIPKMKLESVILELITHLCAAYLLGVNKSALLSAVANKTLTEKQRNSIRKVLLTKIDDFLCSV
ncbi:MAG: hypothetical protein ACFFCQ_13520, partial [Promethearchaeota archaeon]